MVRKKIVNPSLLTTINKAAGRIAEEVTVSFDEAVDSFIENSVIKGLSPETTASYAKELKQIRRVFGEQGVGLDDIRTLTEDDFTAFVRAQLDRNLGRRTINTRLRTAKIFGNFCVRKGYTDVNVAANVEVLKVRHEVGATFTKSQLKRLLDVPNISTFEGLRDLAIMIMLVDTGVRVSELAAVKVGDVVFSERSVNIQRTKNRYARRIPLTKRLQAVLKAYVSTRGVNEETEALFITALDAPLNTRSIQYQIRKHGKDAGILSEVQCSPHVFRRTFAKNKIRAGVDVFTLQAYMGHSDINELRKYVAVYSADLDANIEKGVD